MLLGSFGFSLVLRTENFLNIAHGQYMMVGAYLAYLLFMVLRWPLVLAVLVATVLSGVMGWLTNVLFFRPIRHLGSMYQLVSSVGVAYILSGTMAAIFGPKPKGLVISTPPNIMIAGEPFTDALGLGIVVIVVLFAAGLHLFLTRTRAGLAVRAMSSNFALAEARGIDTKRTAGLVWFIAAGLAGLAGIFMGLVGSIYSDMGWATTIVILSAAVLGGLGSIYGVMIGAALIGLAMDTSVIVIPTAYRSAVPFIIIMLVLIFRPQGIMGSR